MSVSVCTFLQIVGSKSVQNRNPGNVVSLCVCVCVCVCEDQVKVAPASSCVSGRIDHLIQIKDSPSARGRDELVTQCKMETYGTAGLWCQAGNCSIIPPLSCFCHSSGEGFVILLVSVLQHQNIALISVLSQKEFMLFFISVCWMRRGVAQFIPIQSRHTRLNTSLSSNTSQLANMNSYQMSFLREC